MAKFPKRCFRNPGDDPQFRQGGGADNFGSAGVPTLANKCVRSVQFGYGYSGTTAKRKVGLDPMDLLGHHLLQLSQTLKCPPDGRLYPSLQQMQWKTFCPCAAEMLTAPEALGARQLICGV
ncbi:hypothetical protein JQ580_27805 [Bradyrhizobium japonicum]|uniref:hypothetical protein n=1 Tax=Bradyrhizobium japonicum TaxID=375 RepID=UPI001BA72DE2|nr:hypothetical protein [Bradyrhizobium japonicum]MBR0994528.1 hypothetical protein [Bradyrhizobium japonicum]